MIKRFHSNIFYVKSLDKTVKFYKKLGFEVKEIEGQAKIKIGDFTLCFLDETKTPIQNESGMEPKGIGVYTYVEVEDVDKYWEKITRAEIEPRTKPKTWPWGKREFVVKDPDKYKLVFYSPATGSN